MAKKTFDCDVPDCDRKGFKSAQALSMHKFRTHGIRKHPAKAKKKKTTHKPHSTKPAAKVAQPAVCQFCPNCGLNIGMVERAMQVAAGLGI
jgi:hypothetical protein